MNHDDHGAPLAFFLAGAALGAIGALLLAPQSGRETREQLRRRAAEGRERAYEAGRQAAERGRDYYDRGRRVAEDAAESGRHMLDRGRELADEAAKRLRRGEEAVEEAPPPAEA